VLILTYTYMLYYYYTTREAASTKLTVRGGEAVGALGFWLPMPISLSVGV